VFNEGWKALNAGSVTRWVENRDWGRQSETRCLVLKLWDRCVRDKAARRIRRCDELSAALVHVHLIALELGLWRRAFSQSRSE